MTTFIKSSAAKAVVGLLALAVLAIASSASAAYTFTQNLTVGSNSAEVKQLQMFLNTNGFTVSTTGAGSPGMESNYFGTKTRTALAAFQAAKGISPAAGYFGPLTRTTINAWAGSTTLPAGCTTASGYSSTTGQPCSTGSTLVPGCTSTTGYSSTTGLSCAGGSTPAQTGPVTASLSTTNPASGVIVTGQANAKLVDVVFAGAGTVNSVTLKRSGISTQSTLQNVYLYDGVNRLTDGYSFNNNGDLTMNNLNLAVNGSRTISVVADVSTVLGGALSGQTIAVALTSFTSGTTVSSVNVQGNTMSVADGTNTLASVSFTSAQSFGGATVNAGTSSYTVYRQAIQVNTRTVWLKAANFRIVGSAPTGAVANAGLFVDGVKVGNNASMTMANGTNYLSFDLSSMPFALTTGGHTVEVRADIVGGANYNFTVSLQQASDLMILDPQVGVNIAISPFTSYAGGQVNIGAGSATFTVDPAFSAMTNVTGGASNAAIAKFKIRGYGEDVKVTQLTVTPVLSSTTPTQSCPTACGLQNVTLYFNGSQVGSQQNWTTGALTFNLGSQLIIPANTDSVLEVRADLRTTAGANYTAGTVSANLGSGTAEGFTSHTSVPTPAVTGTSLTIQTGLLAVSANAGYTSQNISPNTAGAKIGSFVFQNQSSSESVRVTSVQVALAFTGAQSLTNFSGLRTSEASGSGSTPVQPQASNTFSVDFTLAPGATKVLDIFADAGSVTTGTIATTITTTSIGSSSNVSQTITSVAGQTITIVSGTVATPTVLSQSSTQSQYIAAGTTVGTTNGSKASFNFVGSNGASTISELKVTVTSGTANQTPVSSVTVGGVTAPVVATSTTTGDAYLTNLNIAVPNGAGGANVDVFLNYTAVGSTGVTSGTTATAAITYVRSTSGGTTSTTTPNVSAPTMTVVASKPLVSVNSTQQTGLILGAENKIGEVTISADAAGNIGLKTLVFNVGASGLSAAVDINDTTPVLRSGGVPVTGVTCAAGSATGPITCTFTGTTGATITPGTPVTYSLFATVNNSAASGSTASISTQVDQSGFQWADVAGNSTTLRSGALVYNFPTNSYSIRQ